MNTERKESKAKFLVVSQEIEKELSRALMYLLKNFHPNTIWH